MSGPNSLAHAQDRDRLLDTRELAAVLAGLRLLQERVHIEGHNTLPEGIDDIFQNGGTIDALNPLEIDALCERLNTGGEK